MKIIPQNGRIVVKAIPNEDTKLTIPRMKGEDGEEASMEVYRYTVVAVGPGQPVMDDPEKYRTIPLEVGDEVRFDFRFAHPMTPQSWYGGQNDKETDMYFVVDYGGVFAKIEREPGEKVSRFSIPKPKQQQQQPAQSPIVIPRLQPVGQGRKRELVQ